MRIVNRAHFPWFIFVLVATAFASWLYYGNFRSQSLPGWLQLPHSLVQKSSGHRSVGGTPLGLVFGTIALAIFIFAALLGVRKKLVLWRVGTVQRWMRAHIWLTLLTIPLVLLHCGYRLGGPMTTLLVVLYLIVMVSGIYGLVLQHYLPATMMERLPAESVYEQIPHIRAQLLAAAKKMHDSFKPAPGPAPAAEPAADAGAPAPSAEKAVTVGSAPMSSTSGELSTPTARAKTVVGSKITAETVAAPEEKPAAEKKPAAAVAGGAEPGLTNSASTKSEVGPAKSEPGSATPATGKPETMGTPTARVPEGTPVPAGTDKATGVTPPAVTPQSVSPPTPVTETPSPVAAKTEPRLIPPASAPPPKSSPAPASASAATPAAKPAPAAAAAKPVAAPAAKTTVPTDADSESALRDFLERQIIPYLSARRGDRTRLGNARFSEDTFRFVKLRVTEAYRDRVEEIQAWCDERRMLDLQTRMQHWLHGWLFVHAPISFLLLMLTFWHAFVTLFYY